MGEDTNLIERDIHETRRDLAPLLTISATRPETSFHGNRNHRDHSRIFLGAAFGAGLVFGLAALPRRNGHGDQSESDGLGAETAVGPPPANGNGNGTVARVKHELGETLGVIADGLVRAASASAVMYLSGLVPRFGEHVEGQRLPQRSAFIGSTRDARRDGINPAPNATTAGSREVAMTVGSVLLIWNSRADADFPARSRGRAR